MEESMNKEGISKIIGTISLNINTPDFNYGAILHSWAFQKYLEKHKLCDYTEIINYTTPKLEKQHIKNPAFDSFLHRRFKQFIKDIVTYPWYLKRYYKFQNFIEKNLNVSSKHYNQKMLNESNLAYTTIICESDVIWSPGFFNNKFDDAFFMNLNSMKKMKKIAYAPSMGDGELTTEQEEEMKHLLKGINYISCRESYEENILKKLTEKEITHVLDPVMLLKDEDYEEITAKKITDKKYILLYLPVDDNKKLRKAAIKYAKENSLEVIEVATNCLHKVGHRTLKSAGVEEFLSAIKYADAIFTNSFHAICLSIIFNKDFYAFSRNFYGKVKDICETMELPERFFEDDNFKVLPSINYDIINKNLKTKVEKSEEWLKKALEE